MLLFVNVIFQLEQRQKLLIQLDDSTNDNTKEKINPDEPSKLTDLALIAQTYLVLFLLFTLYSTLLFKRLALITHDWFSVISMKTFYII